MIATRPSFAGFGCLALMAAVVLASPCTSRAGERSIGVVDGFRGSFTHSIAIEAPVFRGLQPALALGYDSSAGGGFAGAGWALSGFSSIERAGSRKGAPRYDDQDVFLLDGTELVPCASAPASPSCTTGGTHATKIESYHRIRFDAGSDTWTVTQKDGVTTSFVPIITTDRGVFRWGQSSVRDPLANTVHYDWACPGGGDCYPHLVAYGDDLRVGFFLEPRPDIGAVSTGRSVLRSAYRLRSAIVYREGMTHIRGYQMHYDTGATGMSRLVQVTQYGTDLVHDAGRITTGTSLPPTQLFYRDDPAAGRLTPSPTTPPTAGGTVEAAAWTARVCTEIDSAGVYKSGESACNNAWDAAASSTRAIVAGDGYVEFQDGCRRWSHGDLALGLTSSGLLDVTPLAPSYRDLDFGVMLTTDVDSGEIHVYVVERGVVKGQFGAVGHYSGTVFRVEIAGGRVLYKRNGVPFYESVTPPTYPLRVGAALHRRGISGVGGVRLAGALVDASDWCSANNRRLGDFDGDGRPDQLCADDGVLQVRRGDGDGFGPAVTWGEGILSEQFGVGDFDGDGKDDVWHMTVFSGDFVVRRSGGSGFGPAVSWGGNGVCRGDPPNYIVNTGDFDGDGRTDVACLHTAYGGPNDGLWVGLSTGTSFAHSQWLGDACAAWEVNGVADFTGDGRDDWYCVRTVAPYKGSVAVQESTGSSFVWSALSGLNVPGGSCRNGEWAAGDYDGDGTTDLVCPTDGALWVSTGRGFIAQQAVGSFCTASGDQLVPADVNGDGKLDLVCNHAAAPPDDVEIRLASAGGFDAAATWAAAWCFGAAAVVDLDGDRRSDLVCDQGTSRFAYAGTPGARPDLLIAAATTLGGRVEVTYAPSSVWSNTNNPPLVDTVSSITLLDGRGWAATTRYEYGGGLYDRTERRFLGFRYVREIAPCVTDPVTGEREPACPYTETWYRQDYGSMSKAERVDHHGGDGALFESTLWEHTTNGGTIPYTSLETGTWKHVYEGSEMRRTYVSRAFDAFGNVVREHSYGDYDRPGDERTFRYLYRPNAGAYLVGLSAIVDTFAGVSLDAPLLARALYHYDGAATWDAVPTRGLITQVDAWLDTENAFVPTRTEHDVWGNVVGQIDALGGRTVTTYDTSGRLPVAVTNPVGHATTTTFHPACDLPVQIVDANGLATTKHYDPLCRLVRTSHPDGGYEVIRRVATGDPAAQYEETATPPPAGFAAAVRRSYIDGLGRVYRTTSSGPTPEQPIVNEELTWTSRGTAATSADSRYAGEAPRVVRFSYDQRDRSRRVVLPDGAMITKSYGLGVETTTNPLGREQVDVFDATGNRVEHREPSSNGRILAVRYEYDLRKNLRQVTDPAGNVWTSSFDSLGRRVSLADPDLGLTTYEHDAVGREIARVDAKNQRTETTYDAAGRSLTRTTLAGTALASTTTWTYDEVRPGYANVGRVTTMADAAGVARYDYDRRGRRERLTRTIDALVWVLERRFDNGGRLLWTKYPDGDQVGSAGAPLRYDGASRLVSVPGVVDNARYDADGRLEWAAFANGTTTSYAYAAERGWLASLTTTGPDGRLLQDLRYRHDPGGRIVRVDSSFADEGWTYAYDAADRLLGATNLTDPALSQSFAYDDLGNMTYNSRVGSYRYGAAGAPRPHAVLQAGDITFEYDANGNTVRHGGRTITWDPDNRPLTIDAASFVYDGNGERLKQLSPAGTSLYLGDDYEVAASLKGQPATKYVTLGGFVAARRRGSATRWLHTDHLGSIRVVTDEQGREIERYNYRPYGERIATNRGAADPRGFTGQRHDETGFIYLHARYLDPLLGRFLSPDPSVPSDSLVGLNRYAYAENDPVNNVDIDGLGMFSFLKKAVKKLVKPIVNATKFAFNTVLKPAFNAGFHVVHGLIKGNFREMLSGAIAITSMVLSASIGPTTAGLLTFIGKHAAVGFGAGFSTALVNGASVGDALKSGMLGGALAGGAAGVQAFYMRHVKHSTTEHANGNWFPKGDKGAIEAAFKEVNHIGIAKKTSFPMSLFQEGKGISALIRKIPIFGEFINSVASFHDCRGISDPFKSQLLYWLMNAGTMAFSGAVTIGALWSETGVIAAIASDLAAPSAEAPPQDPATQAAGATTTGGADGPLRPHPHYRWWAD